MILYQYVPTSVDNSYSTFGRVMLSMWSMCLGKVGAVQNKLTFPTSPRLLVLLLWWRVCAFAIAHVHLPSSLLLLLL